MQKFRVQRGQTARRTRHRSIAAGKLSNGQILFIRKLVYILADIVDEKKYQREGDDAKDETTDLAKEVYDTEKETEVTETKTKAKIPPSYPMESFARFKRLEETHRHLSFQIRSALNALGGGAHTARAMERMQNEFSAARQSIILWGDNVFPPTLYAKCCATALSACSEISVDLLQGFGEIGIFKPSFFEMLRRLRFLLGLTAAKLELEYASIDGSVRIEAYLDDLFEPLASAFDAYILELTSVAENDMAAVRQAQDFSSQRYLNLTTAATFLSNVVATTLQITADGYDSSLSTVTNTLWFISLVFSTASAVYSLLVMIWCRSSMYSRQPNVSLPPFIYVWLQGGPMYTLIAAVILFLTGLCFLAFMVGGRQGGIVTALVPTVFAGINATFILFISTCFLLEQWKMKDPESWMNNKEKHLTAIIRVGDTGWVMAQEFGSRIHQKFRRAFAWLSVFQNHSMKFENSDEGRSYDIESGEHIVTHPLEPAIATSKKHEKSFLEQKQGPVHQLEAAEPGASIASPDVPPTSPGKLLDFSPDGAYLVSAFSDTVTIYEVVGENSVLTVFRAPDACSVSQVAWCPDTLRGSNEKCKTTFDLLVRTTEGIFVWSVKRPGLQGPTVFLTGNILQAAGSARWVTKESTGIADGGIVCAIGTSIRILDNTCKEIKTYDFSGFHKIGNIIDAAFFHTRYIICLATVPTDEGVETKLFVINSNERAIKIEHHLSSGHTSLSLRPANKQVIFHGSEHGAEVVELHVSNNPSNPSIRIARSFRLEDMTDVDCRIATPEKIITLHGKDNRIVAGVQNGEVVLLWHNPSFTDTQFESMHIISTPNTEASIKKCVEFAVAPLVATEPYLFAFRDGDGAIMIWSIMSNRYESSQAQNMEVHDYKAGRWGHPTISTGRYLMLPPSPSNISVK